MASRTSRAGRLWLLVLIELLGIALVALVLVLDPSPQTLNTIIRAAGLLGYYNVFLSIVATAYMRQLTRFFGRSFVNIHHYYTVAGLVLLFVHPLSVAISFGTAAVFVPTLGSWRLFLINGGRPAFWLLALGALVALFRGQVGRSWKTIHTVTYLAFAFGTVHALLLGEDTHAPLVRAAFIAMGVGMLAVLAARRVQARNVRRRVTQSRAQRNQGDQSKR
ncbi:MAG: hypothetical protein ACYC5M_00920 [Anaerolineae bacterium]